MKYILILLIGLPTVGIVATAGILVITYVMFDAPFFVER